MEDLLIWIVLDQLDNKDNMKHLIFYHLTPDEFEYLSNYFDL